MKYRSNIAVRQFSDEWSVWQRGRFTGGWELPEQMISIAVRFNQWVSFGQSDDDHAEIASR